MMARGQLILKHVLKIAKKQEVEGAKGRVVVRFLARRLLNACVQDMDLPIIVGLYLPEVQAQLQSADSKGLIDNQEVRLSGWCALQSVASKSCRPQSAWHFRIPQSNPARFICLQHEPPGCVLLVTSRSWSFYQKS